MFVSKNDFICSDGGPLLVLFICISHHFINLDLLKKRLRLGRLQTKLGVSDDAFLIRPQVKDLPRTLTTRVHWSKNGAGYLYTRMGPLYDVYYVYCIYLFVIYSFSMLQ